MTKLSWILVFITWGFFNGVGRAIASHLLER